MNLQFINKFIENLKKIIEKPPYLIFVFIGAVLMIVSIIEKNYFDKVFIFFLYSIGGAMWRYIEKDFESGLNKFFNYKNKKYDKSLTHLSIIIIYHIMNIGLFLVLLYYLKFI